MDLTGGNMTRKIIALVGLLSLVQFTALPAWAKDQPPQTSYDGLQLQPNTKAALVYLRKGADFTVYDKIALLDCQVSFKKNWQRNQNQTNRLRVSKQDMDEIRAKLAAEFEKVFREELETKGGYQIVDTAAPDVLVLAPHIIELEITVPAVNTAARSRTFSTSAGQMTLVLEMYDSSTGEILGRAADRQAGRESAAMTWHNAATNKKEANRILRTWAVALREALDTLRAAKPAQ
jgi:Protein of unknown function (DUF3313)